MNWYCTIYMHTFHNLFGCVAWSLVNIDRWVSVRLICFVCATVCGQSVCISSDARARSDVYVHRWACVVRAFQLGSSVDSPSPTHPYGAAVCAACLAFYFFITYKIYLPPEYFLLFIISSHTFFLLAIIILWNYSLQFLYTSLFFNPQLNQK